MNKSDQFLAWIQLSTNVRSLFCEARDLYNKTTDQDIERSAYNLISNLSGWTERFEQVIIERIVKREEGKSDEKE